MNSVSARFEPTSIGTVVANFPLTAGHRGLQQALDSPRQQSANRGRGSSQIILQKYLYSYRIKAYFFIYECESARRYRKILEI